MVRFSQQRSCLAGLVLAVVTSVARARTPRLRFSHKLTDLPGVDGKSHSLSDFKKDVLVVAITCNHCPVAVAYEDRLVQFAKKFGNKIDFVAVNVNNGAADKLDKMKVRTEQKGFTFPYLYDESQKRSATSHERPRHARVLRLQQGPQAGLLGRDGRQHVPGQGEPELPRRRRRAALNGKTPSPAVTKAFGCSVKYNSK